MISWKQINRDRETHQRIESPIENPPIRGDRIKYISGNHDKCTFALGRDPSNRANRFDLIVRIPST